MANGLPESVTVQLNKEEVQKAIEYLVDMLGHNPTSAARFLMGEGARAMLKDGRIPAVISMAKEKA